MQILSSMMIGLTKTFLFSESDKRQRRSCAKTKLRTVLSEGSDVESEDGAVTYLNSEPETEETLSMVSTSEKPGKERKC